jgi:small subunit ribosomal protein S17
MPEESMQAQEQPGRRKRTVTGVVVASGMNKTIKVQVERLVRHPKFGKFVRKYTTYYCHDEKREARPGDKVTILSCRPLSKTKRWVLGKIVERVRTEAAAPAGGTQPS